MNPLLVTGDHLLVVVVDVLRGGAGTPTGGQDVPAVLSGGPGEPVAGVGGAAHHQVGVARMSPAVPQLRVPGEAPGPVALHHPPGLQVHDIVVARGDGLQSVAGRVERRPLILSLVSQAHHLS